LSSLDGSGFFSSLMICFGGERAMRGNGEESLDVIRRELQAILRDRKRVTERDLLRLSAQTGVDYSTVVRIQQEIS
jgi:hypothetical protein